MGRFKIFSLSFDKLGQLFVSGTDVGYFVKESFPEGAVICAVWVDHEKGYLHIKCSHPSFHEVLEGAEAPRVLIALKGTR